MVVPRFLAPKGPRGTYSHFWISRAAIYNQGFLYTQSRKAKAVSQYSPLQSFIRTIPKMYSWALSIGMGSPSLVAGPPVKKAISSSKSKSLQGPNTGGWAGNSTYSLGEIPAHLCRILRRVQDWNPHFRQASSVPEDVEWGFQTLQLKKHVHGNPLANVSCRYPKGNSSRLASTGKSHNLEAYAWF